MRVFSVCGISKSGKTTTIERIIGELTRRGYSVGSLKDIHFEGFAIDADGTNTNRHKKAGAEPVTARGLHETDILFGRQLSLDEVLSFYNQDYIVLEGLNEPGVPAILTGHSVKELEERDNAFVFAVSGKIAGEIKEFNSRPAIDATTDVSRLVDLIEKKVFHRLPMADEKCCRLCGFDCVALGERILAGLSSPNDCILKKQVSLKINGQEISMVPFVQQILKNAVSGVAGELSGYQKGRIEVEFYDE